MAFIGHGLESSLNQGFESCMMVQHREKQIASSFVSNGVRTECDNTRYRILTCVAAILCCRIDTVL